eukprot:comp20560_c0_seq1/m.26409 comp20560_c0_seq1/g.26409  ORF comp20560_c0_seq1/g.26409 comp20560_c0_seq1/m.26409 type:complete len:957 (-) comp20560_c0_seq1:290-3160(-)
MPAPQLSPPHVSGLMGWLCFALFMHTVLSLPTTTPSTPPVANLAPSTTNPNTPTVLILTADGRNVLLENESQSKSGVFLAGDPPIATENGADDGKKNNGKQTSPDSSNTVGETQTTETAGADADSITITSLDSETQTEPSNEAMADASSGTYAETDGNNENNNNGGVNGDVGGNEGNNNGEENNSGSGEDGSSGVNDYYTDMLRCWVSEPTDPTDGQGPSALRRVPCPDGVSFVWLEQPLSVVNTYEPMTHEVAVKLDTGIEDANITNGSTVVNGLGGNLNGTANETTPFVPNRVFGRGFYIPMAHFFSCSTEVKSPATDEDTAVQDTDGNNADDNISPTQHICNVFAKLTFPFGETPELGGGLTGISKGNNNNNKQESSFMQTVIDEPVVVVGPEHDDGNGNMTVDFGNVTLSRGTYKHYMRAVLFDDDYNLWVIVSEAPMTKMLTGANDTQTNGTQPGGQPANVGGLGGLPHGVTVGILVGISVALLISVTAVVALCKKNRTLRRRVAAAGLKLDGALEFGKCPKDMPSPKNLPMTIDAIRSMGNGRIPRKMFVATELIGEGQFGRVYKGAVFHEGKAALVAIKTLKDRRDTMVPIKRAALLAEAQIMRRLKHVNVVGLIGVAEDPTDGGPGKNEPLCILLEFMPLGDLKGYLERSRVECGGLGMEEMVWHVANIARGMEYLASQNIVHRDLAARNCMLSTPTMGSYGFPIAKIADFGLARDHHDKEYYRMAGDELLPLRWVALEAITQRMYTQASDVWSFAITAWEVFSDGEAPYNDVHTFHLVASIALGLRLSRPEKCPQEVYELLQNCWQVDPVSRPQFSEISQSLDLCLGACPMPPSDSLDPEEHLGDDEWREFPRAPSLRTSMSGSMGGSNSSKRKYYERPGYIEILCMQGHSAISVDPMLPGVNSTPSSNGDPEVKPCNLPADVDGYLVDKSLDSVGSNGKCLVEESY